MSGSEAEKKFWRSPELVESLLPFLDPPSILQLGRAHPLTAGVLQGTCTWTRFIRRTCPYPPPDPLTLEEKVEQLVGEVRPIIGLLQLIGSPQFHLLQLLETICERFPSNTGDPFYGPDYVKVTCPNHEDHYVSAVGFVLLEQIEAANGSSEQKVDLVYISHMKDSLISALKSRVMRQERAISKVDSHAFCCKTQNDAEALLSLVQHTERFGFRRLAILGPIGEGGWAALVEALRLLPPLVLEGPSREDPRGFVALVCSRNLMVEGRREDVRAVWDALPVGSHVWMKTAGGVHGGIFDKVSEDDWTRLEQYLDNEEAQNEVPDN